MLHACKTNHASQDQRCGTPRYVTMYLAVIGTHQPTLSVCLMGFWPHGVQQPLHNEFACRFFEWVERPWPCDVKAHIMWPKCPRSVALGTHTDVGSDAIFSALLIYDQIKKVSLEGLLLIVSECMSTWKPGGSAT